MLIIDVLPKFTLGVFINDRIFYFSFYSAYFDKVKGLWMEMCYAADAMAIILVMRTIGPNFALFL
jgi:hypothetical protein